MDKSTEPPKSHLAILLPSGQRSLVDSGTSILEAARKAGVEIESICGGRLTCGKCKVHIETGDFPKHGISSGPEHVSPPSEQESELLASQSDKKYRLSCQAFLQGDVVAFVPEEARAHKQIIRKAASEKTIQVSPSIKQLYTVVEKAELGRHQGDWGRLQSALEKQWGITNLEIDLYALRKLQSSIREKDWKVTTTIWNDKVVIDVLPGYQEGLFGLAVDVGSTTIAAYLCDLRTGEILATEAMMNPQVVYGEDLMSRISYATSNADGLPKMQEAVIDALNRMARNISRKARIKTSDILDIVLVGNTTMTHILLGINPEQIGVSPFALANRDAIDIKARELGIRLHPGARAHILPAEAGHVGADNVGVLIAEEPYNQKENLLIIDIGTNAEIFLGNQDRMYSASSPTGPAFEGAQITHGMRAANGAIERVRITPETLEPRFKVIGEEAWSSQWQQKVEDGFAPAYKAAGICGSGIIEVIAEMYLRGIIQPDGRFNSEISNDRVVWDGRKGSYILAQPHETISGNVIVITQQDVRNIQLAKAALYAGAKILFNYAQIPAPDKIILAGAFGSYIDTQYAMILGLIPDCMLKNVFAVGNAAGDGARFALLNKDKRREAQAISYKVQYIETAVNPNFQDEFVAALHIPHKSDNFPHLAGILPQHTQIKQNPSKTRRRGRKNR